jgi:iron(III) transport system permease protein
VEYLLDVQHCGHCRLTHVPHAYLYISPALRSVGSDVEEAARTVGASPLQVMTSVSLPMVRPSILYACVLLFFLGLEVFGLMLVLGDPKATWCWRPISIS